MTKPKYTPGPWKVYKGAVHPVLEDGVVRNDHFAICGEMYGPDAPFNARLIAAAPEMLEALKEARGWVDLASDMGRNNSQALAMIDAVIAKAEGRS